MKRERTSKDFWEEKGKAEIAALREAVKRDPKDPVAHHRLGAALLFQFDEKTDDEGIKQLMDAMGVR